MLDHLKNSGKTVFSIQKLDQLMQNTGRGQFTFDVFKSAYDADPKIKELVKNFDQNKIQLKTSETDDLPQKGADKADGKTVDTMAKRAAKKGLKNKL